VALPTPGCYKSVEICSRGVAFSIEEFIATKVRILKRLAGYPPGDAFCGVVNFIDLICESRH
jgi:hypothetical protein